MILIAITMRTSHLVVQMVVRQHLASEAKGQSQASPHGFSGGHSGTGTGYHVVQFHPVGMTPPVLRTHFFICHPSFHH
jgi:hypothetical protein